MDNYFKNILAPILSSACKKVYDLMTVKNNEFIQIKQLHEDAISSVLLKELAKLGEDSNLRVKIKSLDVKESSTGMDFDIWIGANDSQFVRLIVQAKSMLNETSVQSSYGQMKLSQCEKLIKQRESKDYALDTYKPIPLYFFYQHLINKKISEEFFPFINDFKIEDSSITMASAYSVKQLLDSQKKIDVKSPQDSFSLKFEEIHENKIYGEWADDLSIFKMEECNNKQIGLPITCLSDLSNERIEKYRQIKRITPLNTVGFFFFFSFDDSSAPLRSYPINSSKIMELYDKEPAGGHKIKHVIIIDDNKLSIRQKSEKRKIIISQIIK